jgi:hypothetical protein
MAITQSGIHQDDKGQRFLITQGLDGYTLVAGKQCLFRFFLDQTLVDEIEQLFIKVKRIDGTHRTYYLILPRSYLLFGSGSPNGPSVGVIIKGIAFPRSGEYEFQFIIRSSQADLFRLLTGTVLFLPTKDLLLFVVFQYHEGFFYPTNGWSIDIYTSMRRLGSMFPVRDGIGELSPPSSNVNGLRYAIGDPCDGWTANYYSCVYGQTRRINAPAEHVHPLTRDRIHVTVEFRWGFYDPGNPAGYDPHPGGNASRPPPPYSDLPRASAVGGIYPPSSRRYITAPLIAQEIGHNFGLEPPDSPHYDGGGHSEDPQIEDPFNAFDFIREQPYYPPSPGLYLGDIMSWAWDQGNNSTLFNTFDWEHLRKEIMKLLSTGSDVNPNYISERDPSQISLRDPSIEPQLPTKQQYYEKILEPKAEGYQWQWTTRGIQAIKPAIMGKKSNPPISESLHSILAHLDDEEDVDLVYLPIGDKPLTIAGRNLADIIRPAMNCFDRTSVNNKKTETGT